MEPPIKPPPLEGGGFLGGGIDHRKQTFIEKRHVSVRFPPSNFKFFELSFQSSVATFPRGTCSLSGFRLGYLALDGIYHPYSGCDAKQPYSRKVEVTTILLLDSTGGGKTINSKTGF